MEEVAEDRTGCGLSGRRVTDEKIQDSFSQSAETQRKGRICVFICRKIIPADDNTTAVYHNFPSSLAILSLNTSMANEFGIGSQKYGRILQGWMDLVFHMRELRI